MLIALLILILIVLVAIASMLWTATRKREVPPAAAAPEPDPAPVVAAPGVRGDLLEVLKLGPDGDWHHHGWVQAGSDAHTHVLQRRGLRTADELGVQD
jgi:hypothetical protein